MSAKIAVVILAAGESSRMKQPKQLLPWGADILVNHVIKETLKVPYTAHYIVLGANYKKIKPQITSGVHVLENKDWYVGMGSSIAYAVQQIGKDYDALQFVLVDQPQVDAPFLSEMMDVYENKKHNLIATNYPNSIGIPALFEQSYYPALAALKEFGAKSVLKQFQNEVETMHPPQYFEDMDTPSQYKSLFMKVFKKESPRIG